MNYWDLVAFSKLPYHLTSDYIIYQRLHNAAVRGIWSGMTEDWDDPEMDIYDRFYADPPAPSYDGLYIED